MTFSTVSRLTLVVLAALLALPAQAQSRTLPGGRRAEARLAHGTASFYAASLHGRRTASGERYNRNEMTAAHRTLRFGTRVRVTNLANGRSVVVRINDRGPFHRSRVLDLSNAAAASIGMTRSGTARISYEVLDGRESAQATPSRRSRRAAEAPAPEAPPAVAEVERVPAPAIAPLSPAPVRM